MASRHAILPHREHLECPACLERTLEISDVPVNVDADGHVRLDYVASCPCGLSVGRSDADPPPLLDEVVASFIEREVASRAYLEGAFSKDESDLDVPDAHQMER